MYMLRANVPINNPTSFSILSNGHNDTPDLVGWLIFYLKVVYELGNKYSLQRLTSF